MHDKNRVVSRWPLSLTWSKVRASCSCSHAKGELHRGSRMRCYKDRRHRLLNPHVLPARQLYRSPRTVRAYNRPKKVLTRKEARFRLRLAICSADPFAPLQITSTRKRHPGTVSSQGWVQASSIFLASTLLLPDSYHHTSSSSLGRGSASAGRKHIRSRPRTGCIAVVAVASHLVLISEPRRNEPAIVQIRARSGHGTSLRPDGDASSRCD